jgi:multiple sugar transport system ATP-binding protein
MTDLHLDHITKRFGDNEPIVKDVSLDVANGEFMVLVGPSGCGKSTILRMIAGLEDVTSGDIFIDDRRVTHEPPRNRNLAMVFQDYALYPHLTVFENIAFPLRMHERPDAEVKARVERVAALLKLTELLGRKPAALSGGQRQRVAMGRALVRDADAYLLDEPLSNLDAALRRLMRTEISRLQRGLGLTAIYVTQDQIEALTLGDRVAVLRSGTLQQVDTPRQIYEHPVNMFVASFIGSPPMNLIPARVDGSSLQLPMVRIPLPPRVASLVADDGVVIAGARPEHFHEDEGIAPEVKARGVSFTAAVDVIEWVGNVQYAYSPYDLPPDLASSLAALATEPDIEQTQPQVIVELDPASTIREGSDVGLWLDTSRLHLFDPRSGTNLTLNGTAETAEPGVSVAIRAD